MPRHLIGGNRKRHKAVNYRNAAQEFHQVEVGFGKGRFTTGRWGRNAGTDKESRQNKRTKMAKLQNRGSSVCQNAPKTKCKHSCSRTSPEQGSLQSNEYFLLSYHRIGQKR